jgi:hypothetical protein
MEMNFGMRQNRYEYSETKKHTFGQIFQRYITKCALQ